MKPTQLKRLMKARKIRQQLNKKRITPELGAVALWAVYEGDYQEALVDIEHMRRWMDDGLVTRTGPVVECLHRAEVLALDARSETEADLVDLERDPPLTD